MPKKIDLKMAPTTSGSRYPAPFDAPCHGRFRQRIGDAAGLTQFGVNLTRLPSGCWSSQRHWHTEEDEFLYVLEGEVILISDSGEETLKAGDCAGFKAGMPNGHHLQNRGELPATVLEIGTRRPDQDEVFYPDIDLKAIKGRAGYAYADGTPYPDAKPRNPALDK